VEELGRGSRPEGVQALPEAALELVGTHGTETTQSRGLHCSRPKRSAGDRPAVRLPREVKRGR
jgi:hypothetical protein